MRRYRKGEIFRPPSAAESAAHADAAESHRRSPAQSQDLAPVGQAIIVKTPVAGIDARDGTTIPSAVCTRCIEIDGTSNTKTLVETDEELRIYNLYASPVPGEVYIITTLTLHGTRYVELAPADEVEVITDFQVTGTTLQVKTREIVIVPAGDESAWTTKHTGTECS